MAKQYEWDSEDDVSRHVTESTPSSKKNFRKEGPWVAKYTHPNGVTEHLHDNGGTRVFVEADSPMEAARKMAKVQVHKFDIDRKPENKPKFAFRD